MNQNSALSEYEHDSLTMQDLIQFKGASSPVENVKDKGTFCTDLQLLPFYDLRMRVIEADT